MYPLAWTHIDILSATARSFFRTGNSTSRPDMNTEMKINLLMTSTTPWCLTMPTQLGVKTGIIRDDTL